MATQKVTGWEVLLTILRNKWFWIAVGGILIIYLIYAAGKKAASGTSAPLPNNGTGIPAGWTATQDAMVLHDAMDNGSWVLGAGYGTDEDAIWGVLEGKTDDQLVAIYNEFNRLYQAESEMDLMDWFEEDLEGDDLNRALGYFNGLV